MPVLVSRCRRTLFGCLGRQPPLSGESHETEASSPVWAISLALVPAAWAADPVELQSVVVSASGLAKQSHEMTTPVAVMENDELVLRREATLGETLKACRACAPAASAPARHVR